MVWSAHHKGGPLTKVYCVATNLSANIKEKGDEMHLIISKPGGKPLEALVLAVCENRPRALVAGHTDVVELHRNYGQWSSDLGEVQVEAIIVNDRIDINLFRAE